MYIDFFLIWNHYIFLLIRFLFCFTTGGKKPSISAQAVCSSLKNHYSQWSDFALELGLDDEFRDSLENDGSKSDEKKLESAITSWIEKRTCEVSWDKIITVAKELGLPAATVDSLNKGRSIMVNETTTTKICIALNMFLYNLRLPTC